MPHFRFCAALLASHAATALMTPAATAETVKYTAVLAGTNEVPPITGNGKGSLNAAYDPAAKVLTYTVTYSGLSGPVTAAHFHGATDAAHNAPVMVPVSGSLASPMKGKATLNDAQAAALDEGRMYFNVHTERYKPGEIRGQVVKTK
jgi:hypothetical protein